MGDALAAAAHVDGQRSLRKTSFEQPRHKAVCCFPKNIDIFGMLLFFGKMFDLAVFGAAGRRFFSGCHCCKERSGSWRFFAQRDFLF